MKRIALILGAVLIIIFLVLFLNKDSFGNESYSAERGDTWDEERQANLCDSDQDCELRTVYSCCARGEKTWCVHVNDVLRSEENCAPDMICPMYIEPDHTSCGCSPNKICMPSEYFN